MFVTCETFKTGDSWILSGHYVLFAMYDFLKFLGVPSVNFWVDIRGLSVIIANAHFKCATDMRECWNWQTGRLEVPVSHYRRVGSSPISRTTSKASPKGDALLVVIWDLNGSGTEWSAGGAPEPRPGLRRGAGQVPSLAPRRRAFRSRKKETVFGLSLFLVRSMSPPYQTANINLFAV